MNRTLKHIIFTILLLTGGAAMAQTDSPYVIKVRNNGHYLAHIYSNGVYSLGDLTEFTPECIWYSGVEHNITGTNHNYYFYDTVTDNYRFLTAPMTTNGTLGLSDNLPPTYLLSNTDTIYYFYNWDPEDKPNYDGGGVARGHQYYGVTEEQCTHSWGAGECWDVYWVVYDNGWKTSSDTYYGIDSLPEKNGGRFHKVTVEEHPVVTTVTGGSLANLTDWTPTTVPTTSSTPSQNFSLSVSNGTFSNTPAYTTYSFRERNLPTDSTFNIITRHFSGSTQVTPPLTPVSEPDKTALSYEWTLTGEAAQFLSFASSGTPVHSSTGSVSGTSLSTTVYYLNENTSGTKTATLRLVVTYEGGYTQERTATITLGTSCQNPPEAAAPVVTYNDVTVSWYDIADGYMLKWKKTTNGSWNDSVVVNHGTGNTVSHTIPDLEYGESYQYRVFAYCTDHYLPFPSGETGIFTVPNDNPHELLVYGSIFGGGRMADVKGRTEVVVINCDSIGAVFGGNDIAGTVRDSSIVALGVNDGGTYSSYGYTSAPIRITDVYGGGNGYYAYNGSTFTPATDPTVGVPEGASVMALSPSNQWNVPVWDNPKTGDSTLSLPSITKTSIVVANDYVKVDSLFGGAKNAFLTYNNAAHNADSIVIDGGTILAVFGGNNVGGSQGAGKHLVKVNHTTTFLHDSIVNTATTGYGRDFGIRYLYGGGNKVAASTTDVIINGGQLDTIFAGGNSADVAGANITVNCSFGAKDGDYTFGNVYSNAIDPSTYSGSFSGNDIKDDYLWNGLGGIYNVRTLFGGNNQAAMDTVPTITLTSGSVGTVYGGGNAGDMIYSDNSHNAEIAADFGAIYVDYDNNTTSPINISTHVVLDNPNMLIDYLYGGCQMSNVYRSAWVEMRNGHVGTVYGGCNISGDVGSHYLYNDGYTYGPRHARYQAVQGATYVKVSGGVIYNNLFAGSNGRYHCNNGVYYIDGIDYADPEHYYINTPTTVPTHNETHVFVSGTAEVKGSVYAGGNLACVGFNDATIPSGVYYPKFVGMATVRMNGGTVRGNVFGGGNMASIWGSNSVTVEGGAIGGALYGGNDRIGLVAQITNRVFPPTYGKASDNYTSLADVRTYVSVTGRPDVNTVYGGGNGDYDYSTGEYCDPNDQPVQSNTFVDINIDGYADGAIPGGHIGTVYGGGNGVTVTGSTTVFLNVKGEGGGEPTAYDHVGTIFGGNNKGSLAILPEIILLKGQVNTVYGGCNQGAMVGAKSFTFGGTTYVDIGSMVHLLNEYPTATTPMTPTAKVSNAVYGGCRMNGVTNNSLVLVEGGVFGDTVGFFGGSDISGIISGTSRVVVKAGTHSNGSVIGNAFGGGNGNYIYNGNKVYTLGNVLIDTIASGTISRPACEYTQVDMIGGTAANLYGGGNAAGVTQTATVNVNGGSVTSGVYGGCCSMDTIHGDVTVNVFGGNVGTTGPGNTADIFGGGYGENTRTSGNVKVNIGDINDLSATGATIYGDIYGGSALGHVNDTMVNGISSHTTTVNVLNGSITGDVYGGGLGQKAGGGNPSIAALVQGKTYVNIGATDGATTPTYTGNATISGDVYGCNNLNGTPMDSVFVNIYKTAHGDTPATNAYPSSPQITTVAALENNALTQKYAINAVYGGGNQAAYMPDTLADGNPRSTTVHIYDCRSNTVKYVFGGGNAADVGYITGNDTVHANTRVVIDGGRIHQAFGGGNGAGDGNPGANIHGIARSEIYAGLIDEVFGGANMRGSVDEIDLNVAPSDVSCDEVYGKVFGCANWAPYNKSVTTTIYCGVGTIGELYGGSNMAAIGDPLHPNTGVDVTLNLYGGGPYDNVFAGSKGVLNGQEAPIYGNVTLNLYGGTVTRAFGGSDQNGNITGTVTVNVLDFEDCPLVVDTIFGASNLAVYHPNEISSGVKRTSPIINMMHIKDATNHSIGNIFGGGNLAEVRNANPMVNIGYDATTMSGLIPGDYPTTSTFYTTAPRAYVHHDVFGGGNKAAVTGTDTVNIKRSNSYVENIFGGGNEAGTTNTVVNVYDGTVVEAVYGGCNNEGTVTGDIAVNVYGGTLGTSSAFMPDGIFGGGKGNATQTTGDVTVTIDTAADGTAPTIYAEIYGGSAFGQVGADGKLTKVNLKNGTVYGKIFGGGKGQLAPSYSATVTGNALVAIEGGAVLDSVFGGCNVNGIVMGNDTVRITGGTLGNSGYVPEVRSNVYGGGLGENTKVRGNVAVVIDSVPNVVAPIVYGDVYGGSAKGKVNCNDEGTAQNNYSKTNVTLSAGTIHGSLYGGGHGLENHAANVYGPVTVTVEGGTVTNVFGCNNVKGAPMDSVVLNVTGGTIDSIFGGGNVAAYVAPNDARNYPEINISGGNIIYKVVGGGNNIANNEGISGNPHVYISGGNVCTEPTGLKTGVYGGCNTQGRVSGDIVVQITGSNTSPTTIGTPAALQYALENTQTAVSVHGGGYGVGTSTTGNVTVNYGIDDGSANAECSYPMLYGDLYGGSALGSVNDEATDLTTVNVCNGKLQYERVGKNQYGGNIYGGGLGKEGDGNKAMGQVNGVVQVNIGAEGETSGTVIGKADLKGCNVFGCNNTNGSPQHEVHVDVYQTKHTPSDSASYTGNDWSNYAIRNVYGGGNKANFEPANYEKVYNTIHQCHNTIENVYGGGNAADTYGTEVRVDGGRFNYIFGGGNGQTTPANILGGSVYIAIYSGHVGWYFSGCNLHGGVEGTPIEIYGCTPPNCPCDDELEVENYYFGANEAVTVGGLSHIINCGDNMKFTNVYGGSRLAVVYGDIKLWVRGGNIINLYGGSEGSDEVQADVKKYPAADYDWTENKENHPQEVKTYLEAHGSLCGTGGNIRLVLEGGQLGNVFGGNNYRGNVEGNIEIIVDSTQNAPCQLEIDNLYGGNNLAAYTPDSCKVNEKNQVCLTDRESPKVFLKNGSVKNDVFGGSKGGAAGHAFGNGWVVSNSRVVIGDPTNQDHIAHVGGDVFGGGSAAHMEGHPIVVVQAKATVGGNVYGGGKQGDVIGKTDVRIAPADTVYPPTTPIPPKHVLTIEIAGTGNGAVSVKYYQNNMEHVVNSGDSVPEGSILQINAIPQEGSNFVEWWSDYGKIEQPTHISTECLMGSQNTKLKATFNTRRGHVDKPRKK